MPFINTRADGVAKNVTGTEISATIRALDVNHPNAIKHGEYQVREANLSFTDSVDSTATKDSTLSGVAGYLIKIVGMTLTIAAPSGGASGTHLWYIFPTSRGATMGAYISAAYNASLTFNYYNAAGTSEPNDKTAMLHMLNTFLIGEGDSLTVRYKNSTNVTQTLDSTAKVYYQLIPLLD